MSRCRCQPARRRHGRLPTPDLPAAVRLVALLIAGLLLPLACGPKPPWFTDSAASRPAVADQATSDATADTAAPPAADAPADPIAENAEPPPPTVAAPAQITLEVTRIEAPRGAFANNDELWRMLDELATDPNVLLTARENGFRYALARQAVRPAFLEKLETIAGVRVARDFGVPRTEGPLELELTSTDQDWSVFYFEPAGGMSGKSFDASRPYLNIEYSMQTGDSALVELKVTPELRGQPGPPQYVKQDGQYILKSEYRGERFGPLAASLTLPMGAALVIGPTAKVHELPLLGKPFFVAGNADEVRENLFVLIPRAVGPAADTARSPADSTETDQ